MKQRIITAVGGAALLIIFIVIGRLPFALVAAVIAIIAYTELVAMRGIVTKSVPAVLGGIYVILFVLEASLPALAVYFPYMKLMALLVIVLFAYMVFSKNTFNFNHLAHIFLSAFYIGFSFNLLVNYRYLSLTFVFFIFVIIWSTDSGAYFIGRKFGKKKLAPTVSPNKTIEGAVGGIIIALVAAVIFEAIVPGMFSQSWGYLIFITIIIAVFGQLGDLAESAIKRFYGVKDSGNILPGHGGLLDRFDSLIFVLPILFILNVMN